MEERGGICERAKRVRCMFVGEGGHLPVYPNPPSAALSNAERNAGTLRALIGH